MNTLPDNAKGRDLPRPLQEFAAIDGDLTHYSASCLTCQRCLLAQLFYVADLRRHGERDVKIEDALFELAARWGCPEAR